jgi:hypothetical protein
VSELYRPSDRQLLAKLVTTFAERVCRAVSVTDPYGRILGFLDLSRHFSFQVAPHLYSRGWLDHAILLAGYTKLLVITEPLSEFSLLQHISPSLSSILISNILFILQRGCFLGIVPNIISSLPRSTTTNRKHCHHSSLKNSMCAALCSAERRQTITEAGRPPNKH